MSVFTEILFMPFVGKLPEIALFVEGIQGAGQTFWFYQQIEKLYYPVARKSMHRKKSNVVA